jgi:hypothetical protein
MNAIRRYHRKIELWAEANPNYPIQVMPEKQPDKVEQLSLLTDVPQEES